jgi:phosphoenolpyruvate carboxykinase (ATP)
MNYQNLRYGALAEHALKKNQVKITNQGQLIYLTGKFTGRAAKDKYVVKTKLTEETIDWGNAQSPYSLDHFNKLKKAILEHHEQSQDMYISERMCGHEDYFAVKVNLRTPSPIHQFFALSMLNDCPKQCHDEITIYHAPYFIPSKTEFNLVNDVAIVMNFDSKEILIAGTQYSGEIKKSVFSYLNYKLPELGILPMHSGANEDHQSKQTSIFFGLSGTGKTTLSTDTDKTLIGDDEHGLSDKGIFNFEGGCYAKTYGLKTETEPEIFKASSQFGCLLENVTFDETTGTVNFLDKTLTENGRSSYSLDLIPDHKLSRAGEVPKNMFFLSSDALGVLPPISLLTPEEAKKYFLLGYTAKVAGTEAGIKEPQVTFSHCFGAPFMPLKPKVYADLLGSFIQKHQIHVWLVNTGWYKGAYGVGERFPLKITRAIIRAAQNSKINLNDLEDFEPLNLKIPKNIEGISPEILNPLKSSPVKEEYLKRANDLKNKFTNQINKMI